MDNSDNYYTPNTEFLNVQLNFNEKPEGKEQNINTIKEQNINTIEDQHRTNELSLLYTNDILIKFDLIWDKSKINIVIGMIKYLIVKITF